MAKEKIKWRFCNGREYDKFVAYLRTFYSKRRFFTAWNNVDGQYFVIIKITDDEHGQLWNWYYHNILGL